MDAKVPIPTVLDDAPQGRVVPKYAPTARASRHGLRSLTLETAAYTLAVALSGHPSLGTARTIRWSSHHPRAVLARRRSANESWNASEHSWCDAAAGFSLHRCDSPSHGPTRLDQWSGGRCGQLRPP